MDNAAKENRLMLVEYPIAYLMLFRWHRLCNASAWILYVGRIFLEIIWALRLSLLPGIGGATVD